MTNSLDFNNDFPPLPAYQYATAPIYLEPMIGSGERITIIGAVSRKNDNLVGKLILPEIAEALYGKQSKNILGFADLIIQDLENHLKQAELASWVPCLEGITIGKISLARADNARHALAQIALLHASFCKISALMALDDETEETPSKDNTMSAWIKQVQRQALIQTPDWQHCFNIKETLAQGDQVTLHFTQKDFAANIGLITPINLAPRINDAKIKLWNLDHLPEQYQQKRLILGIPREDAPEMAEQRVKDKVFSKIKALQEEALRGRIDVKTAHTAEEAASLLYV